nr:hypothetical protein [Tanacetum cinerariifolium]
DDTATHEEVPTVTQEPSIPSSTPTIPPSQPPQDIPLTSQVQQTPPQSPQGRMIDEMDKDDDVVLIDEKRRIRRLKRLRLLRVLRFRGEEKNKALQSINETPAKKAAKRRKLNEEVEDLKRYLEIMPDEDDDSKDLTQQPSNHQFDHQSFNLIDETKDENEEEPILTPTSKKSNHGARLKAKAKKTKDTESQVEIKKRARNVWTQNEELLLAESFNQSVFVEKTFLNHM